MARIKWTVFLERVTGKVGGFIFQKWKRTGYGRRRWKVDKKKRSPEQNANCESFGALSPLWKDLPAESRNTWNWYARKANMSGYNAFVSENQKRRIAGEPFIALAPEGELPRKKKRR